MSLDSLRRRRKKLHKKERGVKAVKERIRAAARTAGRRGLDGARKGLLRIFKALGKRLRAIRDYVRAINRKIEEAKEPDWPASIIVAELLYHEPGPHIHFASPERDKLIQIGKIAQKRGLRVGEFPPFDTVECVHVEGSWHYRDSSNPYTPRSCANRGNGCAMDLNDADGGSDKEQAFYAELVRRYR